MRGDDDYPYEMRKPRPLSDRSVEDLFTGKLVPGEEDLAAFAHSVRAWAQGPVPTPTGELARLLADGLTTDKGDLPATAASKATGPRTEASGLPKWRRPLVATSSFLTAMFTKVGMASAAAKTGLAAAVAAGAVTAGAAAGALPAPVQNAVSHAVGAVLPVQLPTDGTTVPAPVRPSGGTAAVPPPAAGSQATDHPSGPPANPGSQSSTGLGTANSTPAAGHAPVSVPTPANPGSQATNHPSGPPAGTASQSTAGSGAATGSGSAPTLNIPISIPVPVPVSGSAPTGSAAGSSATGTAGGSGTGTAGGSGTGTAGGSGTGSAPVSHPGR